MTHTVRASTFEGPFGLLLDLVERGRMEVTSVSVGEITQSYLERVEALETASSESMSEFLQLGSRLLYIKSLALLPATEQDEQGEELLRLNEDLAEYRRFQVAARQLGTMSSHRTWQREVSVRLPVADLPLPNVTLEALTGALERALRRIEPTMPTGQLATPMSQAEARDRILEVLSRGPGNLGELLDMSSSRLEVIVTFLALLELIKDGRIYVTQLGQFEPLTVELRDV